MVTGKWLLVNGYWRQLPITSCQLPVTNYQFAKFTINFLLAVNLSVNLTSENGIRRDQRAKFTLPGANGTMA